MGGFLHASCYVLAVSSRRKFGDFLICQEFIVGPEVDLVNQFDTGRIVGCVGAVSEAEQVPGTNTFRDVGEQAVRSAISEPSRKGVEVLRGQPKNSGLGPNRWRC